MKQPSQVLAFLLEKEKIAGKYVKLIFQIKNPFKVLFKLKKNALFRGVFLI